jgi:hypothetical protein
MLLTLAAAISRSNLPGGRKASGQLMDDAGEHFLAAEIDLEGNSGASLADSVAH